MDLSRQEELTRSEVGSDGATHIFNLLEDLVPRPGGDPPLNRADDTWDKIRNWLFANPSTAERQMLASIRGMSDCTVLHLMCKIPNTPEDVFQAVVEAKPDVASFTDAHGWLPLHHAGANGCSPEVLRCLIEAYPAGKIERDNNSRTPLHFYVTRTLKEMKSDATLSTMVEGAKLLSDSGAAKLTDKGGMLPMHYACAYGTNPDVLKVLVEAHPASLAAKEDKGRTPMHLAMVNSHRDSIPAVVKFLLERPRSRETIDARDHDGYLPLHLMAMALRGLEAPQMHRENVQECLSMYLDAKPHPSPDFLTGIQDLPDWLQETTVTVGETTVTVGETAPACAE